MYDTMNANEDSTNGNGIMRAKNKRIGSRMELFVCVMQKV